VNVFERIVEVAARLLHQAGGFDAHVIETHHSAK
jgi:dihydrodipicolinate reductase